MKSRDDDFTKTVSAMRLAHRRIRVALAQIDAFLATRATNTGVTRDVLLDVRLALTDKHESRIDNSDSDNDRDATNSEISDVK